MPTADELPDEIRALARWQAADIRNSSWDYDVRQIATSLKSKLLAPPGAFATHHRRSPSSACVRRLITGVEMAAFTAIAS